MNSKERMLNLLNGRDIDTIPAAPHWWGLYKFQLAGLASGYRDQDRCWSLYGNALAEVDALFYETFKPDWFHLSGGFDNTQYDEHRGQEYRELRKRVRLLESKALIDEYVGIKNMKADEVRRSTMYDHVRILSSRYGGNVFIAMNEGNPICEILDPDGPFGFENGLIALLEKPDLMGYLIFREYDRRLERIRVLKEYGCHGYIGSETYCTPDLISPSTYRDLIFPAQKHFYTQVREIGIMPIVYFLGDVAALMQYINALGVQAVLIEEPKKGYRLDVVDIRKQLREDITLFGNLDSVYVLLNGSSEDVRRETSRQLEAARFGRFAVANGCPIAFDTPPENVAAMIETAHMYVPNP